MEPQLEFEIGRKFSCASGAASLWAQTDVRRLAARRIPGRDRCELNPLLVEDITEAEIEGRKQVREYARFFTDRLVGCEDSFVNDTGGRSSFSAWLNVSDLRDALRKDGAVI
jgi:hypothetical protein